MFSKSNSLKIIVKMSVDAKVFFEAELPQNEDETLQHNAAMPHKNLFTKIPNKAFING